LLKKKKSWPWIKDKKRPRFFSPLHSSKKNEKKIVRWMSVLQLVGKRVFQKKKYWKECSSFFCPNFSMDVNAIEPGLLFRRPIFFFLPPPPPPFEIAFFSREPVKNGFLFRSSEPPKWFLASSKHGKSGREKTLNNYLGEKLSQTDRGKQINLIILEAFKIT